MSGAQVPVPQELDEGLASSGVEVTPTGHVVREFPWSRVLRLETCPDRRTIWAKWCGDGMAFEPCLVRVIDPRLAVFVRIDASVAALGSASDDALAPFVDWLPDPGRAAGAANPTDAIGVRLA